MMTSGATPAAAAGGGGSSSTLATAVSSTPFASALNPLGGAPAGTWRVSSSVSGGRLRSLSDVAEEGEGNVDSQMGNVGDRDDDTGAGRLAQGTQIPAKRPLKEIVTDVNRLAAQLARTVGANIISKAEDQQEIERLSAALEAARHEANTHRAAAEAARAQANAFRGLIPVQGAATGGSSGPSGGSSVTPATVGSRGRRSTSATGQGGAAGGGGSIVATPTVPPLPSQRSSTGGASAIASGAASSQSGSSPAGGGSGSSTVPTGIGGLPGATEIVSGIKAATERGRKGMNPASTTGAQRDPRGVGNGQLGGAHRRRTAHRRRHQKKSHKRQVRFSRA
jgi:hypothetical protein